MHNSDLGPLTKGFIFLLRQKNNALTPEISPTVDGFAVEEANETLETYVFINYTQEEDDIFDDSQASLNVLAKPPRVKSKSNFKKKILK